MHYLLVDSVMGIDYLAQTNPHPRDSRIHFDEGPHIYTIDGKADYTSVTTWNHSHFEQFDADAIITKMMTSPKWSQNKYFGKTPDEIKEMWEVNRDQAAKAGTEMHYDIECFYNNCLPEDFDWNACPERRYFMKFYKLYDYLKPYRTEWTVFHEELKLAGSIDMTFLNEKGDVVIYDWKRSRGIEKSNRFGKYSTTSCIDHLPDTNFWHYSLQLNVYAFILESKYGVKVDSLFLVCLHPDNINSNFQRIQVPWLREEIKSLCAFRKVQLEGLK